MCFLGFQWVVCVAWYVIHAVGPRHGEEHEDEKLKDATLNSLILADKINLESIAFPAISTGVYGYPKQDAAKIALTVLQEYEARFDRIIACCHSREDVEIYRAIKRQLT